MLKPVLWSVQRVSAQPGRCPWGLMWGPECRPSGPVVWTLASGLGLFPRVSAAV